MISEREGSGSAEFGSAGKPISTRVWAKGQGVISENKQTKYNGKLNIVTIRSLGVQSTVSDITGDSISGEVYNLVSEDLKKSSGHLVYTDVYADGFGLISSSSEDKGLTQIVTEVWVTPPGVAHGSGLSNIFKTKLDEKDGYDIHTLGGTSDPEGIISLRRQVRHNGALEIVTISKIGGDSDLDDFEGSGNSAPFVRISDSVDTSGRFNVYTDVWAAGQGTISTSNETKGDITITTETILTPNGQAHGSSLSNIFSTKVDDRDGYDLHTVAGTSTPSGVIDLRRKFVHNGALEIVTIRKIGAESAATDAGSGGLAGNTAPFTLISKALDESGRFAVYTDVWAAGKGEISTTEEEKGDITVTTEVVLSPNGTAYSTGLSNVFRTKVDERDGYDIYTISGTSEPSGVIETRTQYKHDGKLTLVTIRKIGAQSAATDAGTSFIRISEALDESGTFDIYTDVYAKGVGVISTSSETRGNLDITTEVILNYKDGEDNHGSNLNNIFLKKVDARDGYYLHTVSGTSEPSAIIDRRTKYSHNNRLEILTIRKIGKAVEETEIGDSGNDASFHLISTDKDESGKFDVYTDVWAAGVGRISLNTETKGEGTTKVEIFTEVHISEPDDDPDYDESKFSSSTDDSIFLNKTDERDGYVLHTVAGVSEGGGVTNVRRKFSHNNRLEVVTVRKIGGASPVATDAGPLGVSTKVTGVAYVLVSEDEDTSGNYPIKTSTFAAGKGLISTRTETKGDPDEGTDVDIITEVHLLPDGDTFDYADSDAFDEEADTFTRKTEERDGYEIITLVGIEGEGSGIIDIRRRFSHNNKLETVTIRKLGAAVVAADAGTLGVSATVSLADYKELSNELDTSGQYPVHTGVWIAGKGLLSDSTERKGILDTDLEWSIITEVHVSGPGKGINYADSEFDNAKDKRIFSTKREDRDGYVLHTVAGTTSPSGLISVKTDYRHNKKLTVVTATAASGYPLKAAALNTEFDKVKEDEYEEISKSLNSSGRYSIYTTTWARGRGGPVLRIVDAKGSSGFEIITETWLVENGEDADTALKNEKIIKTEERDGYDLQTVVGTNKESGIISKQVQTKHKGKLDIVTIKKIGAITTISDAGSTTTGGTFVEVSTSEDNSGHFTVHSGTYAAGSGTIDTTTKTSKNGKLLTKTIRALGSAPATPSGYTEVSSGVRESDGVTIYDSVFAKGDGIIDTNVKKSKNAKLVTVTIRALDVAGGTDVPTTTNAADEGGGIAGDYTEVSSSTQDVDGYDIHTHVFAKGSGIIDTDVKKSNNDALITVTIRALDAVGGESAIPTTTNAAAASEVGIAADYAEVSSSTQNADGYDIHTYVFARGRGLVSTSTDHQQLVNSTSTYDIVTEIRLVDTDAAHGSSLTTTFSAKREVKQGYDVVTVVGTNSTEGITDLRTEFRHEKQLQIVTIRKLGSKPAKPEDNTFKGDGDAIFFKVSEDENTTGRIPVFTRVFAAGTGIIDTRITDKYGGALRLAVVRSLEGEAEAGEIEPEALKPSKWERIGGDEQKSNGYTLNTVNFVAVGTDKVIAETSEDRNDDLTMVTKTILVKTGTEEKNIFPHHGVENIFSEKRDVRDGYDLLTLSGTKQKDAVLSVRKQIKHGGDLVIVTVRKLKKAPALTDLKIGGAAVEKVSDNATGALDVTQNNHTGKSVTVDGTILTEGVDWDEGSDVSATAAAIAEAIDGLDGFSASASGYKSSGETGGEISVTGPKGAGGNVTVSTTNPSGITVPLTLTGGEEGQDFTTISESEDASGRFPVFTTVFASGKGEISEDVRNTGSVEIRTTTTLNEEPTGTVYDHSTRDQDGYVVHTWKTYAAASGFESDSRQWLNAGVHSTTEREIKDKDALDADVAVRPGVIDGESSTGLASSDGAVAEGYTQQAPGIWSKSKTTVGVDGVKVISSSTRFNAMGYSQITKTVASSGGVANPSAQYDAIKPDNSVLVSQQTSFKRGWKADVFNWLAVDGGEATTTREETIRWTLPGLAQLVDPPAVGYDERPDLFLTPPQEVSLSVTKKTVITTTKPTVPNLLYVPYAKVFIHIKYKNTEKEAARNDYIINRTLNNWVYQWVKGTQPWDQGDNQEELTVKHRGFEVDEGASSASGTSVLDWAVDAQDAYLSASLSTIFTDGTNTVWRLDTVQGSPTISY